LAREYVVDPVADLRPVCPNCHAVLHSRRPAYSIEEVRGLLE
jgi:predicted HNH restriction endonuclease